MIPGDIQFSAKEVPAPSQGWCHSGHFAPEDFAREGAGTPKLPMRFFSVGATGVNGVYCEACLIVANAIARQAKLAKP